MSKRDKQTACLAFLLVRALNNEPLKYKASLGKMNGEIFGFQRSFFVRTFRATVINFACIYLLDTLDWLMS